VRKNKYAPAAQSAEWPQDACNSLSRRIADLEPLQRLFLAAVSARKVRARNTSMGLVEVGAPEMRPGYRRDIDPDDEGDCIDHRVPAAEDQIFRNGQTANSISAREALRCHLS
jgi:hypothetical protein